MEKKMLEMSNELTSLRATFNSFRNSSAIDTLRTPNFVASPVLQPQSNARVQPGSSMSPLPQSFTQPMFIQGSSSLASIQPHQRSASPLVSSPFVPSPAVEAVAESISQPIVQSITPDPSPHLSFVETSRTSPTSSGRPTKRKHKRMPSISSSEGNSSSSSSSSVSDRQRKRTNHHDTRCYTIHVSHLGLPNAAL
jgi:hypothetical protein